MTKDSMKVTVQTISYVGSDGDHLAMVRDMRFENVFRPCNPDDNSFDAVGTWEHWVNLARRILEIEDRRKAGESDG